MLYPKILHYLTARNLVFALLVVSLSISWILTIRSDAFDQKYPEITPQIHSFLKPIWNEISSIDHDEIIKHSANTTSQQQKVEINSGDTLSVLFDRFQFKQKTLQHILSADESLLALETLKPGNILIFRHQKDSKLLQELELFIHHGHRIIYRRISDDQFNYESVIRDGQWRSKQVTGNINNTFYLSAQDAGLTEVETATVAQIFKEKINFQRTIHKGDKFQIVRSVQYVDDQPTGQTRIKSARIQQRTREHTAFLFEDGRYYDKDGESLSRAFIRTPLAKSYRVSSPFNPKRVHPVTGRIGPHNGTDFATPTGTKVLTTGDGIVTRVGNHPYAGRYIEVQHGGQYKTRYLHLHKILVKHGQSVNRGQIIALSGNTGRSTGPHLHFELHINNKPVDPMKAKIPVAHSINAGDKTIFLQLVINQTALLDNSFNKIKFNALKLLKGFYETVVDDVNITGQTQ